MHENSSTICTDTILTQAFKYIIGCLLGFIIFFSIAGNILVCIAIYTDRRLRKMGNIFLISLALADLFMASIVMTFALANDLMGYWAFGPIFCDAWISMDVLSTTASILNLAAISLDRYFHIKDPLSYERWMTRRLIIGSIVIIWSLSAMVSFVPISLGWHRPPNIGISNQISPSSSPSSLQSSSRFSLSMSTSSILQSNSHQVLSASSSPDETFLNSPTFSLADEYHQTQSKSSSLSSLLSSGEKLSQVSSAPLGVMNQSNFSHGRKINNDSGSRPSERKVYQLYREQSDENSQGIPPANSLQGSSSPPRVQIDRYPLQSNRYYHESDSDMPQSEKKLLSLTEYSMPDTGESDSNGSSSTLKQVDSSEIVTSRDSYTQSELYESDKSEDFYDDDEYDQSPQCALDLTPIYAVVSSAISFYIPCLIMIGLYTQLYLYAKKHVQNIRSFQVTTSNTVVVDDHEAQMSSSLSYTKKRNDHQHNVASGGNNSSSNPNHHPHQVTEHKAAITLGIIMGTFLLCWVPFFIVNIIGAFCKTCIPPLLFKILTWLGYFNSAMNPVIYSIFNTEFREAFKKILVSYVHNECCNQNYRRASRGVHDPLVTSRPSFGAGPGGNNSAYQLGQQNTSLIVSPSTPSGAARKTKNTPTPGMMMEAGETGRAGESAGGRVETTSTTTLATTAITNMSSVKITTPRDRPHVDSSSAVPENSPRDLHSRSGEMSPIENSEKLSPSDAAKTTSSIRNATSKNSADSCLAKGNTEYDDDEDVMTMRGKIGVNCKKINGTQIDTSVSSVLLLAREDEDEDQEANFDQTTSRLIPSGKIDRNIELSFCQCPCNERQKTSVTSTLSV